MDIDYQQKKMNWGNFTKVKRIGTNIKKNRLYWLVRKDMDVYTKPTLHLHTNERKVTRLIINKINKVQWVD
jgi:putative methionine-R-sulfoxide reductase with GAF domain